MPAIYRFWKGLRLEKENPCTKLGLDINGTHQVLAFADDVNLIGDDIRTIERNADVLLNAIRILV